MANDAHVTLFGARVMQEPMMTKNNDGKTYLRLNVAVQTTKKDPNPKNEKYPYLSDFYNVSVFGDYADRIKGMIKAGSKLDVIGTMYMGEPYTSKSGKVGVSPQVNASEIKIIGGGNWQGNNNGNTRNNNYSNNNAVDEEEAPF